MHLFDAVCAQVEQARAWATGRPGQQRERRLLARQLGRDHAAVGLHDQQQPAEADALQARDQLVEIVVELGPDVRVQRGRAHPLVEADRRQQVGGHRQVGAGQLAPHDLGGRLLVGRVGERVHEADRHCLHALAPEQLDRLAHRLDVERRGLGADAVDAAPDAGTQVARHQRLHVGVAVVVLLLADAAAHLERVAHPAGGEQPALRAGAGQRRVGRHRRAVHDGVDGRRERLERQRRIHAGGDVGQSVDHRDRRIGRRRQRLEDRRLGAVAGDDEVGEGAADVDADLEGHGANSVVNRLPRGRPPAGALLRGAPCRARSWAARR